MKRLAGLTLAAGIALALAGCSNALDRTRENSLSHLDGYLNNIRLSLDRPEPDLKKAGEQAELIRTMGTEGLAWWWERDKDPVFLEAIGTVNAKAKGVKEAAEAGKADEAKTSAQELTEAIAALRKAAHTAPPAAPATDGAAPETPAPEAPKIEEPKAPETPAPEGPGAGEGK